MLRKTSDKNVANSSISSRISILTVGWMAKEFEFGSSNEFIELIRQRIWKTEKSYNVKTVNFYLRSTFLIHVVHVANAF